MTGTTTSWDVGRRRECGNLLRAIAADAGHLADQTTDPDDRRTLRTISRDAAEFATKAERYGPGPEDPGRVAEWAADLEAIGDPAAAWGRELYQLAGALRMFYVPDLPADTDPAGTGKPAGHDTEWNTTEQQEDPT